jgi:Domain of unknown function (DUF4833)
MFKKGLKSICLIILALLFQSNIIMAQNAVNFPKPNGNPNQLFFLQRTPNANTVVYELNIKNGELDSIEPVHIFWVLYGKSAEIEELTSIQRKYAYGLSTQFISKDHYELRFLANKKYVLQMMKGSDYKYHVNYPIENKQAILSRIYLHINGGSLFAPNIEYVEFTGINPESGAELVERKKI